MILLIDNYDSFVYNLARYFELLGQSTHVVRNDKIRVSEIGKLRPDAIVLSPGPCGPAEAGCCLDVVNRYWCELPILGVCLGHQVIAESFGAQIVKSPTPMHGCASDVYHESGELFAGLPSPISVGRYHSLVASEKGLPDCLSITATTADNVIMALRHRERPVFGVQFHPESILTDCGMRLLGNFLELSGINSRTNRNEFRELVAEKKELVTWPERPVTF